MQRSSLIRCLYLKVDPSEQGASSSVIPPRGADSINQTGVTRRQPGGRDILVMKT
jgi:hypothetical protein